MGAVLGIVYRCIATHLVKKAGFSCNTAQTGAVTLIQRFGSALNRSLAKYYSSGNRQLEQAAAMLFPCVAVYRSRVRNTVTTDFSGRIAIERGMRARMIVIPLEVCKLSLEVSRVPEQSVVQKLTANGSNESLNERM